MRILDFLPRRCERCGKWNWPYKNVPGSRLCLFCFIKCFYEGGLVDPDDPAYARFKPVIDSLLRLGLLDKAKHEANVKR